MKPTKERTLNITIRGTLPIKMTEQMEKLFDDFWEKEKKFYEDDSISEEEYEMARSELENAIENEIDKLYPNLEDFYVDDFEER